MIELIIKNFRAFGEDGVTLSCGDRENILCYGENGTGKSSIFEAIKLVFHRTRLEQENVSPMLIGDDRKAAIRQFLMDYNNKTTGNDFSVKVNGQQYNGFDSGELTTINQSSWTLNQPFATNVAFGGYFDSNNNPGRFFKGTLADIRIIMEE